MDENERRQQERRQDIETASQITEAAALQRAFGSDAAQRFLKLRGIAAKGALQCHSLTHLRGRLVVLAAVLLAAFVLVHVVLLVT